MAAGLWTIRASFDTGPLGGVLEATKQHEVAD